MRKLIRIFLLRSGKWGFPLLIALGTFIYGVSQKGWDHTFINGDGKGYYAYLPAVFIYNDLSFGFIEAYEKEHYQPGQLCDFRQPVEGGLVNRYYIGTAVAQLPFFLITHSICKISGYDADGYGWPYQYAILLAGCFYLFIGLWALNALLGSFFPTRPVYIVLICITFATPLIFYTVFNPDFSHIYSFAFISLFIWTAWSFFQQPKTSKLLVLFLILGIIAIIRPVNLIVLGILPYLAGDWKTLLNRISFIIRKYWITTAGIFIFFAVVFVQLLVYFLQTGSFLVYSYGEAGLDFLHPNFINFLFSYKKGMFLYTPLLFISLIGFIPLFNKDLYRGLILLLFMLMVFFVLSSWNVWSYGMTYGQRPVIEYYFMFAILLGYLCSWPRSVWLKGGLWTLLALLLYHNQLQISQHRHYILHWDDMTREKYWKVFLQTDPIYYGYLWSGVTPCQDDPSGYKKIQSQQTVKRNLPESSEIILAPRHSVTPVVFLANPKADSLHVVLSFYVYPTADHLKNNWLLIQLKRKTNFDYKGFNFPLNLRNLYPYKWNEVRKKISLPVESGSEEFLLHILNKGKYDFKIKEVKILEKDTII